MRLVCISDTHLQAKWTFDLPDGDILIHAGDHTPRGERAQVEQAAKWLGYVGQKFDRVISIPGNHDFWIQDEQNAAIHVFAKERVDLLIDTALVHRGFVFYGSPWTPWFHDWAYNLPKDDNAAARQHWSRIPMNTDVLITHGPPKGILDTTITNEQVGCPALWDAVMGRSAYLQAHIFGHIHEAYGTQEIAGVKFVNASTCNRKYMAVQEPIVIDIEPRFVGFVRMED